MSEGAPPSEPGEPPPRPLSTLAMTAEDHRKIGSTGIDHILLDNPGKTLGELLPEEDLLRYLMDELAEVKELSRPEHRSNPYDISRLTIVQQDLEASVDYLVRINRLPKKFVQDLEGQ